MKSFVKRVCIALSLSALTLFSCDPAKKYESELKTIDSCLTKLDSLEKIYVGIDFDSLDQMAMHVLENEAKLKAYNTLDTVDQELGAMMNDCKGFRILMENVQEKDTVFGAEIIALRQQFTDLKADVLNGVIEKEKISEFLQAETASLDELSRRFLQFDSVQQIQTEIYHTAVPGVDNYLEKLNTTNVETTP